MTAPMIDQPVGVAVVGFGYWGPNIARNLVERPERDLLGLCELDSERAAAFSHRYRGIPTHSDLDAALIDASVEAVAIGTPRRTHHALDPRAAQADKPVIG